MPNFRVYWRGSRTGLLPYLPLCLLALLFQPSSSRGQTTYTVCPPGNPSAPCDYASPEAALADTTNVSAGDTLEVLTDSYVLGSTLVLDRGLTLEFNGSLLDANGQRGVLVDGAAINGAQVANLADSGTSNFLSDTPYGQTFTAPSDFVLTQFQLKVRATSGFPTDLDIPGRVRAGGRAGPVIADANAFVSAGTAGASLTLTFRLERPVALTQGSTYGIEFVTLNGPYSILQAANPYPDGIGYNNIDLPAVDYAFAAIGGLPVTINDAIIRNGQAPAAETGGAIRVSGGGVLNLTGTTLEGNSAGSGGGGVANADSFVTVVGGNLSRNGAGDAGGAVLTSGFAATTELVTSTIAGNRAVRGGGLAALAGGRIEVTDSTISSNGAVSSALDLDFSADNGTSISGAGPLGQTFTAGIDVLTGFSFVVRLNGGADPIPDDLVVSGQVREGGPTGAVVATAAATIPGGLPGGTVRIVDFELDAPLALAGGNSYGVEIVAINGAYSLLLAAADPGGQRYGNGVLGAGDFAFRTFGGPAGEGGGIYSAGVVDLENVTVSGNVGDGAVAAAVLNTGIAIDRIADSGTSIGCAPQQTFLANTVNSDYLTGFSFRIRFNGGGTPFPESIVQGVVRRGDQNGPIVASATAPLAAGTLDGSTRTLTFTLDSPIALTDPSGYTLEFTPNGAYTPLQAQTSYADGEGFCAGNPAPFGDWAFQTEGGEFTSSPPSTISATLSTFFGNSGNGLTGQAGTVTGLVSFGGSILAANGGSDCSGDPVSADSLGYNLIGDATRCGTPQAVGDQWGDATTPIDPLLGPLQDNGGATLTHALDPLSPAVDAGIDDPTCGLGTAPFADQRGVPRPQGAACDTGSYELAPPTPLQDSIDAAAPGSTVNVPDGVYNERITLGDGITLQGSGPGNVVIDATGLGGSAITSTGAFTLTGIRVTGGDTSGNGGGIHIDGAGHAVTLDDVRVDGNSADGQGAGIYVGPGASLTIGAATCAGTPAVGMPGNLIDGNSTLSGQGGGIYAAGGLVATDTQISGNNADQGGGIYLAASASLDLDCSVLATNGVTFNSGAGGGIMSDGAAASVARSLFEANSGETGGGGIDSSGSLTVSDAVFRANRAAFSEGGAIRGGLSSSGNTFEANETGVAGGAVFVPAGASFLSSTDVFLSNTSRTAGGAISVAPGADLTVANGLFDGNSGGAGGVGTSGTGGAVFNAGTARISGGTRMLNNSGPESGDGGGQGGAIYNSGDLILEETTIDGSSSGDGGALFNAGTARLIGATLSNNAVTDINVPPRGGAIASTGSLAIANSTITGNVVNPGGFAGTDGDGGGVAVLASSSATLNNVTVAFNRAPNGGALYAEPAGTPVAFGNSLFFDNEGPLAVCDPLASQGYNLFDATTCPTADTDIIGDALLGLLADNGGLSRTHALLPGSPAQDAGAPVPLSFTSFDSLAEFTTRGFTTLDNSQILLAGSAGGGTVGSAYLTDPVDVTTSFSARFQFQIIPGSGGTASDGLTITFTDDPALLTDGGGALGIGAFDDLIEPGYNPTGPQVPGVSVEFDTWLNGQGVGASELDEDHIGIDINGSLNSVAVQYLGGRGILSDGSTWTVWLDYDAASNLLEVRASNTGSRPASPNVSTNADIAALADVNADGEVFVGFTGAAGSLSDIGGEQRISSFEFSNEVACELVDQRGVTRPQGSACDIGAFEANPIPASIENARLSVNTSTTPPGVVDVPLIDIPIEKLAGGGFNAPEAAPLSSLPLSSFPLSSLDLRASPLSSFPLSSLPLSSLNVSGAPLSSFPLSSLPLLSVPGGWAAVIADIPSLAGAPLQTVTLQDVVQADASAIDGITLQALSVQDSPLSSLSLPAVALGETIDVAALDAWLASEGLGAVCATLASQGFTGACASTDTYASLEIRSAPLSSLPLSSLPLSSFPLSSLPLSSFPLSSLPLSSFPLSSFPLSSFPLSSLPLSSFPLSSLPLSSLPLSSFPLSSLDLLAAPLSSLPLSSFPLSSLPLSSLDVAGESFCAFYDAAAAASGQSTCAALGLDPASETLGDLVVALATAGEQTLASTPLSSLPLSSLDIADAPLSSFQLDFADVAGAPLSSFPLSSLPLSSLDVGGSAFCTFWDAAAFDAGQDTCAALGVGDGSTFGDLIVALQASGETTFAATPLSSFPLSSLPLSSLPLSSFPLSSLVINGAPLSSLPLSSFDLASSPLSSLPLSSFPLSSFGTVLACAAPCEGFDTLGEAWVAGLVNEAVTVDQLFPWNAFLALTYGDLTASLSLEYLLGAGTLGEVADFGALTFGQLLLSLILRSDFPWETIPLADLDVQSFAADHFVSYTLDFQVDGTEIEPVTVAVAIADGFHLVPGSTRFATRPQVGGALEMTALPDPLGTSNGDGTQTLTFAAVDPGAFSDNMLEFITVPPLALGAYAASAELALGTAPPQAADGANAGVLVQASALNDASDLTLPALTDRDTLILGHIDAPDDIDYYRIEAPPKGSRVSVFMANPGSDNDLAMYEPVSAVEAKGQLAEGTSLDSVPFEDDGVNYVDNRTEEPDALEDVNLAAAPLSSLSTNRGDSDELVSSIGDGVNPFTIQVSGYNSAVSPEPYSLRVRVVPEVPAARCTPRSWPFSVPAADRDFIPAGAWTPATSAVFLVNWNRLAASDPGGATAANEALNAVNALVNAPGIVDGVVVDVATIPGVDYGPWDADPCDPAAANAVVNAITGYLEAQRAIAPNLAYVTVVGSDEVIPFARKSDETAIANESTFAGEFSDNAMFGTHLSRNFLSDDSFGDIDPIPWLDRWLNVPELAVGRLVESAADIRTAAENYVISGGVLTPIDAVSAGYDFIFDASSDIQDTFGAYGLASTPLLDPPVQEVLGGDGTVSFVDNQGNVVEPWDRAAFLAATGLASPTQAVSDLVSFNMHFDFDEALPSSGDAAGNYADNLINVADLDGNDLTGRLWFTVGCHSGTSVADISVAPGDFSVDWPQKLNELGAVYIGQAAYGLGDTVALALTERLLANFARNLGRTIPVADGAAGLPISAGQAHAFAKQDYFADLGLYGEYDFKALQASVYFGLPMYRLQLPQRPEEPLPVLPTVQNDPLSGLAAASLAISPVIQRESTDKGEYFSVDGDAQFIHYRPLQPIVSVDVTSETGAVARGAFITALTTEDLIIDDMAFARPVVDLGELEPEIETQEIVFPTTFASISSYRAPAEPGPFEERQQLNLIVGQYTKFAEQDFGTQRLFTSVDTQVFYRPAGALPKSNARGGKASGPDEIRPEFDNIRANVLGGTGAFQATFSVAVSDAVDAAGTPGEVRRVAVLYRQAVSGSGEGVWVLADLVKGSGDTWTGGGPVADSGLVGGHVDYLVQAVDASGNVANSTFKGVFYTAEALPPAPEPPSGGGGSGGPVAIALTADGQPVAPNSWVTFDPVLVTVADRTPGVGYEFSIDGAPFADLPPASESFPVSGDGAHLVTVQESGGANPVSFAVLIDTTPPAILFASPAAGAFVVQGTTPPVVDFDCIDSGSGPALCSGSAAAGSLAPDSVTGEQTLTVSSQDFAGNGPVTASQSYYVVQALQATGPIDPVDISDAVQITATATELAAFEETVTVDWGDGTPPETVEFGGGSIAASHVYAAADVYEITVRVDYEGRFEQTVVVDLVVYDPDGGFVTGGGWIDSPPGAYYPDASRVGKAHFSFNSRYKRGRSTPDGNTNFRFKAAGLQFKPESYEWMVISGARARLKGEGRFKGDPELYQFRITALDGDVDRNDSHDEDSFRIRIWGPGGVVYDNGLDADDSTGDGGTTALGGGSINIKSRK